MRRREFVGAMTGAGLDRSAPPPAGAAGQPNLLILMSDQHNPHVLGCRGDSVVKTPHLDALAASGVSFENTYCQAPICVPARMSFLTGQQPSRSRVWHNTDILPSDVPTFAHGLGAAGYETVLVGRMHFEGVDQWHGFEKLLVGNITPIYPHIPHTLPKRLLIGAQGGSRAAVELAGPGSTTYQAHDEQVAAATAKFLMERPRTGGRPFCAVAGFVLPHSPYICSRRDWNHYYDRVALPEIPPGYFERLHPAVTLWRKNRGIEDLPPETIRRARAAYYGLVTHFDRLVGTVMSALRNSGLDRNTIVIYTSDHGDMAGENGMWWKNSFYEGSVTVPLMVSFPGTFPSGAKVREIVSLVDVGPTLLELAGARPLPNADGTSLVPLLRGEQVRWANEAFSEFPPFMGSPAMRMVRSGRWKLNHYESHRPQLFDLEADPHEYNDLGESRRHAAIRTQLHGRALENWPVEEMKRLLAERARDRAVMNRWAAAVKPPAPQRWQPPPGANVFPEPSGRGEGREP
ncbi:MAG: sulfatase-like hydrolase/transferase [Acidobacteria bacterium]|nr:sulfatase-like hydrolase/transferase [Acidobacteriota bacterium]